MKNDRCSAIADNGSRCRCKAVRVATVRVDVDWCGHDSGVRRDEYVQAPLCKKHVGLRYYDEASVPLPGGGLR